MNIPEKLKTLNPYDPADFTPRLKLDANESFITPPYNILNKINSAIASIDLKKYPDPVARDLCIEAAELYDVPTDCVAASNGSDEMISILFNSFLNKGGRVLLSEPDFSMYRFYAHLAEVEIIKSDKKELTCDIDEIIRLAKEKSVSLVIFSNPCNPTGTGNTRGEILRLIHALDCPVVIDEAYMDFWDESIVRDAPSHPNSIVLRTCSKAFGIAGVRLGFTVSNSKIISLIKAAKSPFNVNSLTQAAGLALMREKTYLEDCISRIKASKNRLFEGLKRLNDEHPGFLNVYQTVSNFVLIKSGLTRDIYAALLKKGILVRIVMNEYLRITAGGDAENFEVIECIGEFLKNEGNDTAK